MFSLVSGTLILYIMVIFAVRLMGKKQLSELQPSELVTTIIISNIVTISLEESNVPLMAGIVPILLIVSLDVIITGLNLKSGKIRKITTGTPEVIISDGIIDQTALRNLRYTIDDVMESMREASIFAIDDVQFAIVENTGKISFYEKTKAAEANAPAPENIHNPQMMIVKDGELDKKGLQLSGLTEDWLGQVLNEKHASVKDVFLLTADSSGTYTFIEKQKKTK